MRVPGILARDLCLGGFHACALLTDGGLQCWGSNIWGQLGSGDPDPHNALAPVDVRLSGPARATQIACGFFHTCALLSDGTTQCWGLNRTAQLGTSDFAPILATPAQVLGP